MPVVGRILDQAVEGLAGRSSVAGPSRAGVVIGGIEAIFVRGGIVAGSPGQRGVEKLVKGTIGWETLVESIWWTADRETGCDGCGCCHGYGTGAPAGTTCSAPAREGGACSRGSRQRDNCIVSKIMGAGRSAVDSGWITGHRSTTRATLADRQGLITWEIESSGNKLSLTHGDRTGSGASTICSGPAAKGGWRCGRSHQRDNCVVSKIMGAGRSAVDSGWITYHRSTTPAILLDIQCESIIYCILIN